MSVEFGLGLLFVIQSVTFFMLIADHQDIVALKKRVEQLEAHGASKA